MLNIGWSAIVIRKQISAPRLKFPLNDTTKDVCKTRNKAKPAKVEINAGGVANISFVNSGAYRPNRIANTQMIKAEMYCCCLLPPLYRIAFTGPVKHVETEPNIAVTIDPMPQAAVIMFIGGLWPLAVNIAMP